jgi:hypothetical protein
MVQWANETDALEIGHPRAATVGSVDGVFVDHSGTG